MDTRMVRFPTVYRSKFLLSLDLRTNFVDRTERRNIEACLQKSDDSPMTQKPLKHQILVPNHQMRGEIESWKELLEEEQTKEKGADRVIPAVRPVKLPS